MHSRRKEYLKNKCKKCKKCKEKKPLYKLSHVLAPIAPAHDWYKGALELGGWCHAKFFLYVHGVLHLCCLFLIYLSSIIWCVCVYYQIWINQGLLEVFENGQSRVDHGEWRVINASSAHPAFRMVHTSCSRFAALVATAKVFSLSPSSNWARVNLGEKNQGTPRVPPQCTPIWHEITKLIQIASNCSASWEFE